MQKNWLVINVNKKYFLKVGDKVFRCQIGTAGFKNAAKKIEVPSIISKPERSLVTMKLAK